MRVKVKRYNGERRLQRGLEKMIADGWWVQDQQSRKRVWRLLTGFFTRQQVHTVTFAKFEPGDPQYQMTAQEAVQAAGQYEEA